jgi:hypothetical protein
MRGVARRVLLGGGVGCLAGGLLGGVGGGDLHDTCMGRCCGGVDCCLEWGDLDLLDRDDVDGCVGESLAAADFSLGRVNVLG